MNGIATIIARVSSTDGCKKQNLIVQNLKNLKNKEDPYKTSNQNNPNHQK
jgi:hypothetical protein